MLSLTHNDVRCRLPPLLLLFLFLLFPLCVARYRRTAAFNRKCGIDVHEISPEQVAELFPAARTDDILAGFYVEDDGRVNPVDAAASLAKGARMQGVKVVEECPVTNVTTEGGRVTGVTTASGQHIKAEYVVNAAGMWARQLGELAGVNVPNQVGV